jgi:hypothetical protein
MDAPAVVLIIICLYDFITVLLSVPLL